MPVYEYRCEKGHTFEVTQRMTDPPVTKCETCGAPVQRVFHPVAVHFKGKGFYNTDYGTRKRERETVAAGEGSADGSANGAGPDKPGRGKEGAPAQAAGKSESRAGKPDGASKVSAKS